MQYLLFGVEMLFISTNIYKMLACGRSLAAGCEGCYNNVRTNDKMLCCVLIYIY